MGKTYRRDSDSFDKHRKKAKIGKTSKKAKFNKNKAYEQVEPEE